MGNPYNPIIKKEKFSRWRFFAPSIYPSPGIAIVLQEQLGDLVTLMPGTRRLAHEMNAYRDNLNRFVRAYYIDISDHSFSFDSILPSIDPQYPFHVKVRVVYSVMIPELIIKRNIEDPRKIIQPIINERLRLLSREFHPDEFSHLEKYISQKSWFRDSLSIGEWLKHNPKIDDYGIHFHPEKQINRYELIKPFEIKGVFVELFPYQYIRDLQRGVAPKVVVDDVVFENFFGSGIVRDSVLEEVEEEVEEEEVKEEQTHILTANISVADILSVGIKLPANSNVALFVETAIEILESIDSIYTALTILQYVPINDIKTLILRTEDVEEQVKFVKDGEEIYFNDDEVDSDKLLFDSENILKEYGFDPMRIHSVHYGSPVSFDLLGIGSVLENVREIIKDISWRGKHEKELAETERMQAKLNLEKNSIEIKNQKAELEKSALEREKISLENTEKLLDLIIKARNLPLSDDEKTAIVNRLASNIKVISDRAAELALIADGEPSGSAPLPISNMGR